MRLIDADELYKRTAEWEKQAQDEVNKDKGCRTAEEWDKYKKWLIILNERSSFKYDIADAPTIEAEPVKYGRWIVEGLVDGDQNRYCRCSECGKGDTQAISQRVPYCWWCGAKMDDTPTGRVDTPTENTNRPTDEVDE